MANPEDFLLAPDDGRLVWLAGLELISPPGFESYFAEMAELFASGVPDPTWGEAIRQRYGLDLDLAGMPQLIARHSLAHLS